MSAPRSGSTARLARRLWPGAKRTDRLGRGKRRNDTDFRSTFETRSLLGGSLLGRKEFAEAEPLLLRGYEGLKAREVGIPAPARKRLNQAGDRIIRLYEAWDKSDQAAAWKVRLGLRDLPADVFARP